MDFIKVTTITEQFSGTKPVFRPKLDSVTYTLTGYNTPSFTLSEVQELRDLCNRVLDAVSPMDEIAKKAAEEGRKIDAIKRAREVVSERGGYLGLKEAKDLVEEWMRNNIPVVTNTGHDDYDSDPAY